MQCPKCNTKMQVRNGMYGEFYFCPNQHKCGQKTITSPVDNYDYTYKDYEREQLFKTLDCSDYDIYGDKINKDDNGYGEPCEDSGFWENEGEWYRPY